MTDFMWLLWLCLFSCSSEKMDAPCKEGFERNDGDRCEQLDDETPLDADADADADADSDADSDFDPYALSNCDEPLEGIDWGITPPDARGGFQRELEALDLLSLPETIDISQMDQHERGWVAYTIEISAAEIGDTINRDEAIASGIMGRVMLGSIVVGDGSIDQAFFRRGLNRYYVCSLGYPVTLQGFKELVGYPTDFIEVDSLVKCGPRIKGEDFENGIFVAQAVGDSDDHETEILLTGRRADNALEFLVYGPDDRLTNRSTFPVSEERPSVVMPAPWTCTTCHSGVILDTNAYSFDPDLFSDVLIPAFGNICY
jgi:hypothetical protein